MQLVTGGNANAVRLTEENDWYIVPVVNPDGYKYSWTSKQVRPRFIKLNFINMVATVGLRLLR